MKITRMKHKETKRLIAVKRFEQYDFDLNTNLQGLLKLASDIYETPVAFITLIDEKEQWFKARIGFEVQFMPRNTSFCTHAIMQEHTMVVSDALHDDRFTNNPMVNNAPNIRFYAGAPLCSNDGQNIGTLCVMDVTPKEMPEYKRQQLEILAKQAMHLMELQLTYNMLNEKMVQIERQNKAFLDIAFIQSHEFRSPVSAIMGLMNIIKEEDHESQKQYLDMMDEAIKKLDDKVRFVVKSTEIAMGAYVN
jgi:K+-sensing histidine kinase KdpD